MKSTLSNYKAYPFSWLFILEYIPLCAVGMILLDAFAIVLIQDDGVKGFFNMLLGIIFMLAAFLLILAAIWIIIAILGLFVKGPHRGIGLYRFLNIVSVLCPIAFAGMIAFLKKADIEYDFFNFVTLLLEFAIPPCVMLIYRLNPHTKFCNICGLVAVFDGGTSSTKSLGTYDKYHTEGGYYRDVKTKGHITENNSVAPEVYDAEFTTRQYIPKTKVYDGKYEKRETTTSYRCSVCGNYIISVFESDKKIDN